MRKNKDPEHPKLNITHRGERADNTRTNPVESRRPIPKYPHTLGGLAGLSVDLVQDTPNRTRRAEAARDTAELRRISTDRTGRGHREDVLGRPTFGQRRAEQARRRVESSMIAEDILKPKKKK